MFCFEGGPKKKVTHLENFDKRSSFRRFGVELRPSLSLDHYDAINRDKDLTPNPEGLFFQGQGISPNWDLIGMLSVQTEGGRFCL